MKKTRKLEVGRKGLVEDVVNLLSAGQSADGQPRGSTTSAVKTKQDKDSGTRSQPVVTNGASATSSSGSGETTLFCEPCEKEFASEAAHKAHLLSHVPCPEVGCNFSASRKVISAHHSATHGRFSGSGFQVRDQNEYAAE